MKDVHPCESTRNRLLAEAQPLRVPAELQSHLEACGGCQMFLARYRDLARDLKALPAPNSELKKLEFTQMIEADGPIIRSMPSRTAAPGIPWRTLAHRVARPILATAAAIAVGIGVWSAFPGKRGGPTADHARHELLGKIVAHNAALAKADSPAVKLRTLTDIVQDLEKETARVALVAQKDDIDALADMYVKVVNTSLLKQAEGINKFEANRNAALRTAAAALSQSSIDLMALSKTASTLVNPAIVRMQTAASNGSVQLAKIAGGAGS